MGLNDQAWERLFEKYRILEEVDRSGRFMISASQIKEFREPRLMTKFDHKVNLPALFRDNRLSILPVTRGDYLISSFSAYQDFEEHAAAPVKISIPPHLQSLLPEFLVSEAIALNCALACGVLGDFLEDGDLAPTVSGQMGSGEFAFDINTAAGTQRVAVSSSQIEIDGAYEGSRYLSLFEAKRDLSDDFQFIHVHVSAVLSSDDRIPCDLFFCKGYIFRFCGVVIADKQTGGRCRTFFISLDHVKRKFVCAVSQVFEIDYHAAAGFRSTLAVFFAIDICGPCHVS